MAAMKRNQHFLLSFHEHNSVKMLTLDTVHAWKNFTRGKAVVRQNKGANAAIKGIQLERIEIRKTRHGMVHVCVLKACNPDDVSLSHSLPELEQALKQLKEVHLVWASVPVHLTHCSACLGPLNGLEPALFEHGNPVCSAYCSAAAVTYT